jgi:hypothetical protein
VKVAIRVALLGLLCMAAYADTIKLRDGRVFSGQFLGATRTEIWFQHDTPGEIIGTAAYPIPEVQSLTFGQASPAEQHRSSSGAVNRDAYPLRSALITPRIVSVASGLAKVFASIWRSLWRIA